MSVTRVQLVGNVSTGASFVGVVTATNFVGNLTGNASYASVAGVATYASVAGVSTYASVAGAPGGGGGTAALPAIAFDGDPNTGLFSPGADQLAVATNGVERVEFGTSEVVFNDGGANYDFRIEGDTNANLFFVDASAEAVSIGTSSPSKKLEIANGDVRLTDGYTISWGDDTYRIFRNGSQLRFDTNGSQALTIDSSGRLLVGTSSTSNPEKLHVHGQGISLATFRADPYSYALDFKKSRSATDGTNTIVQSGDDLGNIAFAGGDGTNWIQAARITAAVDGTPGTNDMPGRLVFSTTADGASSPTERMRIINTGYVGINATAPTYNEKLGVTRTDTTTNAIVFQAYNSAATSTTKAQNALVRLSSNASGADGHINITDNIAYNYNFGGNNGGAYVQASSNGVRLSNGGTSWASDSDERVKDIIEPIDDGLSKVSTLRAVIGKYKTDDEDRRRTFLIAQDVQAVLPEAVYEEQGTLMLAYTDIIPLLVAALKESKERIEQLEAKVAALESA